MHPVMGLSFSWDLHRRVSHPSEEDGVSGGGENPAPSLRDRLSMALTHLLPLLVSLQFLPQPVSPEAPHPAPAFSIDPRKDEYLLGDTVALMCSADPLPVPVTEFHYYSDTGLAVTARASSGWKNTYKLNITGPRNAGEYSCAYYTGKSGRFTKSRHSTGITIKVKDPPAEPTLNVDPPSREVTKGHPLVVTCTAPEDPAERRFHFYQDGAEIEAGSETHITAPGNTPRNFAVLSIPQVNTNSSGEYACGYEEKDSGRWIPSTRSQAVKVTLKGPLPPPELRVDPTSGAVDEGMPLNITCMGPEVPSEQRFHFYKNGTKIDTHASGPELSIPQAGLNMAGEFSCGYEEKVNGRWVPSPRSQAVTVIVKGVTSLPIPLVAGAVAGAVALVLLLLLLCLCVKKRKGSRWSINRPEKDGSISSYSPIPLASMNPDTF